MKLEVTIWIVIFGEVVKDQNALREYLVLTLGSMKIGIVPENAPSVAYTNYQMKLCRRKRWEKLFYALTGSWQTAK